MIFGYKPEKIQPISPEEQLKRMGSLLVGEPTFLKPEAGSEMRHDISIDPETEAMTGITVQTRNNDGSFEVQFHKQ